MTVLLANKINNYWPTRLIKNNNNNHVYYNQALIIKTTKPNEQNIEQ